MAKQGADYEMLVERIFSKLISNPNFEKVERNVLINGHDGVREFDVILTTETAGLLLRTAIECKDHGTKLSVGIIDAFYSKLQDCNINKGIIISRKGFSSTAIRKAKRLGISIYTAHEALNPKWDIEVEIPIVIHEIKNIDVAQQADFVNASPYGLSNLPPIINDLDVSKIFIDKWNERTVNFKNIDDKQVYIFEELKSPLYIKDSFNKDRLIQKFTFEFKLKFNHYFGYLNKVENAKLLFDILEDKTTLFLDSFNIYDIKKKLILVKREDIPKSNKLEISVIESPTLEKIVFHNYDLIIP